MSVSRRRGNRAAAPGRPKQGPTRRETRRVLVPSKPTQVGLEPRHSPLSEGWRRMSIPRLLGECPPERPPACKPAGRSSYSASGVWS